MIYYYARMAEHDKYIKNHNFEEKKFRTLKEAGLYATRQKINFWKTCVVRKNTKNDFDFRVYEEVEHGKWKRII